MSEDILTSDVLLSSVVPMLVLQLQERDMGRTASIKGDITNGTAILMSLATV